MKKIFTKEIMRWHSEENKRIMPWKGIKDPYKIWISEVILQQTRVVQGVAYYNNFIQNFPTLASLALADEQSVFKVWEGLGYYSRCKNLLYTARQILETRNGIFPETYEEILELKGIGPYTASAIASFAYGLPHAVVDGNVFRVLARFFGINIPVDSNAGKKHFTTLANELLYKHDPAKYNQAIMDFGATICKPQNPICDSCVLSKQCFAYNQHFVTKLPVKEKELKKRTRWLTYFVFLVDGKVLIKRRSEKDIWENLFEFYLVESEGDFKWTTAEIESWLNRELTVHTFKINSVSRHYKQQLTHQRLNGRFISITLDSVPETLLHYTKADFRDLTKVPFPRLINQYLQENKDEHNGYGSLQKDF